MPDTTPIPVPTPYDIVDIPFFPYQPGLFVWVLLLTALMFSYFLLRWLLRRSRNRIKNLNTLAQMEVSSIKSLLAKDLPGNVAIFQISLVLKRFLAACLDSRIASFSAKELQSYSTQMAESPFAEILKLLQELEDFKYDPQANLNVVHYADRTVEALQNQNIVKNK